MVPSSSELQAYSKALVKVRRVTGEIGLMKLQTFLGVILMGHNSGQVAEPKTIHHLADWLCFPPSTVYQHIKELSELGLVDTRVNPHNRRQAIFYLTHRGHALAGRLEETLRVIKKA